MWPLSLPLCFSKKFPFTPHKKNFLGALFLCLPLSIYIFIFIFLIQALATEEQQLLACSLHFSSPRKCSNITLHSCPWPITNGWSSDQNNIISFMTSSKHSNSGWNFRNFPISIFIKKVCCALVFYKYCFVGCKKSLGGCGQQMQCKL